MPNDVQDWTTATVQPQDPVTGGNPWAIDTSVAGGSASKTFTLPLLAGIHVVGFGLGGPAVNAYQNISITGHQTGCNYRTTTGIHDSQLLLTPILSVYDTQLDVIVGYTVGSGILDVWVASIKDAQALQVLAPETLPVVAFDADHGREAVFDLNGGVSSQGVSLLNAAPAPWQAANREPKAFNVGPGAGASSTVIAAPGAGLSIWLHAINQELPVGLASSFGEWQDGSGGSIDHLDLTAMKAPHSRHFAGGKLPTNTSLVFKNTSAVGMGSGLQGSVAYSIG
jgi:hypothetical protein